MGFIGVEWDHPWIYWWPPFGDTAWAGSLGPIPSTFEVAVTRATSSHSLTILTISKDGWSTLKYFEVLIIDLISPRPSKAPKLANMVATKCSQTFTNGCGRCGVFQKWLGTSPSIPKIPQVQFFFGVERTWNNCRICRLVMIRLKQWSLQVSSDAAALQLGDLHRGTGGPIFNDFHGFFDQRPVPKKIIGPSSIFQFFFSFFFFPRVSFAGIAVLYYMFQQYFSAAFVFLASAWIGAILVCPWPNWFSDRVSRRLGSSDSEKSRGPIAFLSRGLQRSKTWIWAETRE